MSEPKIAFCISGQPRTMEFCFPSIKTHILDIYHPDVFIVSDSLESRIQELFNPIDIEIHTQDEEWLAIGEKRTKYISHDPPTVPERNVSIFWKSFRCGEMLREHERLHGRYDIVLIGRFDVVIHRVQAIAVPEEGVLCVPRVDAHLLPPDANGYHFGGYSAQLCWCSSRVASLLFDEYFWSDQYYQLYNWWGCEPMLRWFLERHGIKIQHVEIDMSIKR